MLDSLDIIPETDVTQSNVATHAVEPLERVTYLPTLAEIKAACAEIQAGWSPEEREKRTAVKRQEWAVPGGDRVA